MKTYNIPFSKKKKKKKKKITITDYESAAMVFFSKGLKNEFETAVINEPSVFEPLKFYCILSSMCLFSLLFLLLILLMCKVGCAHLFFTFFQWLVGWCEGAG